MADIPSCLKLYHLHTVLWRYPNTLDAHTKLPNIRNQWINPRRYSKENEERFFFVFGPELNGIEYEIFWLCFGFRIVIEFAFFFLFHWFCVLFEIRWLCEVDGWSEWCGCWREWPYGIMKMFDTRGSLWKTRILVEWYGISGRLARSSGDGWVWVEEIVAFWILIALRWVWVFYEFFDEFFKIFFMKLLSDPTFF